MTTSRRSLFGLFGAVAAGGASVASEPVKAEPLVRRYINGKLICQCKTPAFDEVKQSALRHTLPQAVSSACAPEWLVAGHPLVFGRGATHSHGFTTFVPVTETHRHCIYCGGIEAPEASA